MENYVVSRDLAEKLKAAGYPQKSELSYIKLISGINPIDYQWSISSTSLTKNKSESDRIAAPLTDELLEQLPIGVENGLLAVWVSKVYTATYEYHSGTNGYLVRKSAAKPADALASLWLWCQENGYLK